MSLRLRLMTPADLPFADSLRALAGWNQTIEDWQRLLANEPNGCFLAEWSGAPVGTATTTVYAPNLAWIGMVLVHPTYRRRGIGRTLVERCIDHLRVRDAIAAQPIGIEHDLVLLDHAADARDFGDARHALQLEAQEPVLQRT